MTKRTLLSLIVILVGFQYGAGQTDKEKKLGEETFLLIQKTQGIYDDKGLLAVVKQVGRRLESEMNLGYPLTYYLVDTYEPNAFATAGGYVYVTRGLFAIINNKDELAGILAHELSHVTEHHVTKQMKAGIIPLVLELPGKIVSAVGSETLGSIINAPVSATSKIGMAAYSRKQEKEADKLGVELAIKAGYNPYGLAEGLSRLTRYVEFITGKEAKKNILIDHPMTADRTAYLTEMIEAKKIQKVPMDPGTDIIPINGLIYGENPKEGVVNENVFLHPIIKLYCKFPEEWSIQNSHELLTAINPKKDATILVAVESDTVNSPSEVGKKWIAAFKQEEILFQEETSINGNAAFRVTIKSKSRFSGQLAEVMILQLASSKVMLRVVGISSLSNPDKNIVQSFNSFREMNAEDFNNVRVNKVELLSIHEWEAIEELSKTTGSPKYLELLQILNGLQSNQNIPTTRYLKVIGSSLYIP